MKRIAPSLVFAATLVAPVFARADARTHAFVHVAGPDSATIDRRSPNGGWETVCYAPCDRELALGVEYRIGGDGVRTSAPFYLDRDKDRIELDAGVATSRGHHAGVALAATGGGITAVGVALISAAYVAQWQGSHSFDALATGRNPPLDMGFVLAGVATTVVGAVLATTGIVLAVQHGKTDVEQVALAPEIAPRAPTWRDVAPGPTVASRPTMFSLFSGSF